MTNALQLMQYDRQRSELGYRIGGACHYGENSGMILTDAEVVEVLSSDKIIARLPDLSDILEDPIDVAQLRYPPFDQPKFEPLFPVEGAPLEATVLVRESLRRVQAGFQAALQREKGTEGAISDRDRIRLVELYGHPDGRLGYLNSQAEFSLLDPDKTKVTFISNMSVRERSNAPLEWSGFGCVALSPEVRWPVAPLDAENSIADFACASVRVWDGEWRGGFD